MFDHVVSPLLNCMIYHIFLINIPRGMNIVDIKKALTYVAHYSVVKERAFVSKELAKQLRAGHIDISHGKIFNTFKACGFHIYPP